MYRACMCRAEDIFKLVFSSYHLSSWYQTQAVRLISSFTEPIWLGSPPPKILGFPQARQARYGGISVVPVLRRWRQKNQELRIIFSYGVNLRPAWILPNSSKVVPPAGSQVLNTRSCGGDFMLNCNIAVEEVTRTLS